MRFAAQDGVDLTGQVGMLLAAGQMPPRLPLVPSGLSLALFELCPCVLFAVCGALWAVSDASWAASGSA